MNVKRLLKRQKFNRISVVPGDAVQLLYREPGQPERLLVSHDVIEARTFDEGLIFEGEFEGRYAIGGAFVEEASE